MREVRTCDFCGEEAAGTFEVVPAERDPTGEGRRMVLCPGCRDTLASVLEPLLGTGGATGSAPGGTEEPGTRTVVAEPDRDDPAPPSGDGTAPPGGEQDRGQTTDGVSPADPAPDDVDSGGNPDGPPGGNEPARAPGGRPRSTRSGTPSGYRKVMRFLENRAFPMEREEAETLAAEAYGMDREAVAAAIDHAVKHNRLREAGGKLRQ